MDGVTVLVVIAVGLIVGLVSGLVGIGGGALMVPFLYFFYDRPDLFGVFVTPEARVVLAHGTSLFFIVPTSVRGVAAYKASDLIEWRAVWPIGIASLLSAVAGARLAVSLPPELLKSGFGLLLLASGLRLVTPRRGVGGVNSAGPPLLSPARTVSVGIIVGLFSALLGVGGGTVGIPLMIYALRFDVRKVAATSIAIVGLTSTAGTLAYIVNGLGEPGLPSWSLGYVHVAAGLLMFVGAFSSVRWGAAFNQRLKPRTLEVLFGMLFLLLGTRLLASNVIALVYSVL